MPIAPGCDRPRTEPCAEKPKSSPGLRRIGRAFGYSWAGLFAAYRHEVAFRQELVIGLPLLAIAWWLAPGRLEALALSCVIVLVWVVELLNSAIENLADSVTTEVHPLIGRAKDMGSAAVMLSIAFGVLTWAVVLWP